MGGPEMSKRAALVLFRVLVESVREALLIALQRSLPVLHLHSPYRAVKAR